MINEIYIDVQHPGYGFGSSCTGSIAHLNHLGGSAGRFLVGIFRNRLYLPILTTPELLGACSVCRYHIVRSVL